MHTYKAYGPTVSWMAVENFMQQLNFSVYCTKKIQRGLNILHLIPAPPWFYHQSTGTHLKFPKLCWSELSGPEFGAILCMELHAFYTLARNFDYFKNVIIMLLCREAGLSRGGPLDYGIGGKLQYPIPQCLSTWWAFWLFYCSVSLWNFLANSTLPM